LSEPVLIDTHAHVQMAEFDSDRHDVLERFRMSGGGWMVSPGVDLATSDLAGRLAEQEPDVVAALGVHPEDCADAPADYMDQLRHLLYRYRGKTVAIGEIGLDFKDGTPDHGVQRASFEQQLQLASDEHLPVIVHSRFAVSECLDMIARFPGQRGVMHCFGGTIAEAQRAVNMGLHVSFTGNITYPGSSAARDVVKSCPLDRLLLETDSPYLAPVPMRGRRNEPSYVSYTYQAVGSLLGRDPLDLSQHLERNARELFNQQERSEHAREENVQDHAQQ
jgi:TatD DNase family protein